MPVAAANPEARAYVASLCEKYEVSGATLCEQLDALCKKTGVHRGGDNWTIAELKAHDER